MEPHFSPMAWLETPPHEKNPPISRMWTPCSRTCHRRPMNSKPWKSPIHRLESWATGWVIKMSNFLQLSIQTYYCYLKKKTNRWSFMGQLHSIPFKSKTILFHRKQVITNGDLYFCNRKNIVFLTVVSHFKKRNGNSAAQFYSDQEWSTRLQARHVDYYLTCSMLAKLLQIVAKKAEMVNPTKASIS